MSELNLSTKELKGFPEKGPSVYLTPEETAFVQRILSRAETFPEAFWSALIQKIGLDGLPIPPSQVQGLTRLNDQVEANRVEVFSDYVATIGQSTSGTFIDLATTGPTVSDLAAGSYLINYGSLMGNNAGVDGWTTQMGIAINGAAVNTSLGHFIYNGKTAGTFFEASLSLSGSFTTTLAEGDDLQAKYRVSNGGTGQWQNRFLVATKLGS
jgi:hypothetical protein